MVRLGGADGMNQIAADNNFNVPPSSAGEHVAELVAMEPFQDGFLAANWDAPDGESGVMASQGGDGPDGELGARRLQEPGGPRRPAGDTAAVRDRRFLFPEVEGGSRSAPTRCLRRRRRIHRRQGRPPETVDFLGFLTNVENQRTWGTAAGIPNIEATAVITETPAADGPVMQTASTH